MKALSLIQPWATLVAIGAKRLETRSWLTTYRGPVVIHASKGFPVWAKELCYQEPFRAALEAAGRYSHATLPVGCLLAVGNLTSCVRITAQNAPPEPERSFGDYTPGRYAWHFGPMRRLPEPIPIPGALGLWNLPVDVAEKLTRLLA